MGVYIFTPAVHEAVRHLAPSWRGELEITEAIQWLIDHGRKVRSTTITGYWKDTGNVADMLEVNRMVLESVSPVQRGIVDAATELIGRVVIDAGAEVSGSRIVGPVIIGAGTRVSGSYIGPFTSVAGDCVIADSEIEYSIVLRGASIQGVRRIEASLIGHDVEVTPAPKSPEGAPAGSRRPQQGADQLMRILVAGGAGFIGSHYVRTLLGGGYPGFADARVTVLDKLTYAGTWPTWTR